MSNAPLAYIAAFTTHGRIITGGSSKKPTWPLVLATVKKNKARLFV